MAVITAAIFRSIITVTENQRPPGGPHRSSSPSHQYHDRPGGKSGGGAGRVRGQLRLPPIQIAESARLAGSSFRWMAEYR
jgi:hypothetical protein